MKIVLDSGNFLIIQQMAKKMWDPEMEDEKILLGNVYLRPIKGEKGCIEAFVANGYALHRRKIYTFDSTVLAKPILIPMKLFKDVGPTKTDDVFTLTKTKAKNGLVFIELMIGFSRSYKRAMINGKYPNVDLLIPTEKPTESCNLITINPKMLNLFVLNTSCMIDVTLYSEDKPILLHENDEFIGIFMPIKKIRSDA